MSTAPARPHELPFEVRWGDCDPAGIIWYPAYYRWMDAATWALMASAGYDAARVRDELLSFPLVHAECDFIASPRFGDACVVRSTVARCGGKSFSVAHEFVRGDGVVLARGREDRVWCRYESGPGSPLRGVPLPDAVRALLSGA